MLRQMILLAVLASAAPAVAQDAVEAVAGPPAVLMFEIRDAHGHPIPARLTFVGGAERSGPLLADTQVAPRDLAIRGNVVYTRTGQGRIEVPPGNYEIIASRGIEYDITSLPVRLSPGKTTLFSAVLTRQVDTSGWVSGDFHLHTLTHSGHGDANMNERIISLAGEGVEFAVATDHNHNTDYDPVIADLDLKAEIRAVVGNEVSTPIGHFNTFPLDPARAPVPADLTDAAPLFRLIRAETNAFGVVPVIQLNHPRWGGIDFFTRVGLDPITGQAGAGYSPDFDTIEVLNENEGWGYYDAERAGDREVGSSRYSVLQDWFNLLNRGHRAAAVGNSDSHHVHVCVAGYPRNFVRSGSDAPGEIDPAEIASNLRRHQVFTTNGPFVTYERQGDEVIVDVRSVDWIVPDRVKLIINGDVVEQAPLADGARVRATLRLPPRAGRDYWMTVIVDGSTPLPAWLTPKAKRPLLPLAICNPTWVDADGDGNWRSPLQQAVQEAAGLRDRPRAEAERAFDDRTPTERGLLMLAAAEGDCPHAVGLIRSGLRSAERATQMRAFRAAERLADASLAADLERIEAVAGDDYRTVALLRARQACAADPDSMTREWLTSAPRSLLSRYGGELVGDLPATIVRAWQVVGYFPNPSRTTLIGRTYGPETDAQATSFIGKDDATVAWTAVEADQDGYLDLNTLEGRSRDSIAYARCQVHSESARRVPYAVGTDDGARLWLNGRLIHEDTGRHGAEPFQHIGTLDLRAGWNDVLVKVENAGGGFGLYLRVFEEGVRLR